MPNQNQNFKPLPRNVLDFGKLSLYTDKLEDGERRPQFSIRVIRGFVHATVRTGIPTDIKNGYMSLKIDPKNFYAFMSLFKDVLDEKKSSIRLNIEDRIYKEEESKYSDELFPLGALKVARDKDKKIYLSLVIENRPKIQFYFRKEFNSVLKKDGGEELTEAEYSQLFAQSYYMMIMDLVPKVLNSTSKLIFESPFIENNNPSSENTDKSQSTSEGFHEFDDDIPF